MHLCLTTDYKSGEGDPRPALRAIAESGFTHIHWCHQWNTDFVYTEPEIRAVLSWLREYGLHLNDLHGSVGPEKNWCSPIEYQRRAGIELVRNRIEMTARLGGRAVVMHLPPLPPEPAERTAWWDRVRRAFDALAPVVQRCGVRIALENLAEVGGDLLEKIFREQPPEIVGLCFDSGHAHVSGEDVQLLERFPDRLIAVHLHDNDGSGDQHRIPFTGTIDWDAVARGIARSDYGLHPLTFEVAMRGHADEMSEREFLEACRQAAARVEAMVAAARRRPSLPHIC